MSLATNVATNEDYPYVPTGFSFENYRRNQFLASDKRFAGKLPEPRKTGTTICGALFDGGVVLGADTRSTANLVAEKDCEKIHYISPNIYCCGAGTAADTEFTTAQISSELELLRYESGKHSRVKTALTMLKRHLFQYQGHVSAALVLGGVDISGPYLHTVYPHGSFDTLPFVSMGSGSLAAMSVLETGFKEKMSREECIELVSRAIRAGVMNDLGSGNSINYCIIEPDASSTTGFKTKVEIRKGTDLEEELNEVARQTVLAMDVNKIKAKVNRPPYFASFPPGTTVTIGEPIVEKF